MLNSMTGYGRVKQESALREITVEIRSVNHRYLDVNIKVPRVYGFLEELLKKQAASLVARGKVDIYVSVRDKEGADLKLTLNTPVAMAYLDALSDLSGKYDLPKEQVTASMLIRMPEVLSVSHEEVDSDTITAEVMAVFKVAIGDYNDMRRREGMRLCDDILMRAGSISDLIGAIEKRSPVTVEEYRKRITARMNEILDGSPLAEQRILSEAALFADKVSVTEEVVRLRSHISQLKKMLISKSAVGKKLDFLVQEMNREANTIGSKASDFGIATHVVDLKAEIEKIREQVQNIE